MKRLILTIGILSSILQGCQLTEVDGYVGGSSIYFSIKRDTMTYSWGTVDSDIQERVLELPIYLFGEVKDYDRKIQNGIMQNRFCSGSRRCRLSDDNQGSGPAG